MAKINHASHVSCRVPNDDFMVGLSPDHGRIMLRLSSDYPRVVFLLAEAVQRFLGQILNSKFRGRRIIW